MEVKPKDIMDAGGLDLTYDADKSLYYVYKDGVELGPKESRFFEVEVEDIWVIPQKELDAVKSQAESISNHLAGSSYADQAKATFNNITVALGEIAKGQLDDTVSREQHIGMYRQNVDTLKRIKEEISRLEKLLQPTSGSPDILEKAKFKMNLPTKSLTWLIILIIIIFLGMLAGVFFLVWQAQVRSGQEVLKAAKDSAFPGSAAEQKPKEGQDKKTAT